MKLSEFEWAREIAPGFALVLRWPRVNVWPYLYAQCWRRSLTFRPVFVEKSFGPELMGAPALTPVATKKKKPKAAAKRVVFLEEI
jgi:hypothetical protein